MPDLDTALLDAWHRVVREVLPNNPQELWRRAQRRNLATYARPPRAWCLALRSSDRRLDDHGSGRAWDLYLDDPQAVRQRQPHALTLTGRALRRLCAPVSIDYPGVPLVKAAAMLGRHRESLRNWMRKGVFQVRYDKAQPHGHFGGPVPVVWCPHPLDPNAAGGDTPHPVWGSDWQWLHQRVPDDFEQDLERLPRRRPYRGQKRFRGWDWLCPGRTDADGEHQACGRRVQTLYTPLPVFEIADYLGQRSGLQQLTPRTPGALGLDLVLQARRPRELAPLACAHCWRVRNFTLKDYRGWNEFVSYLSGGLLYGREVKRPAWTYPD